MKKMVLLLTVIMLSAGVVYASKYPKYDAELSKVRTVKNAQTAEINIQIKEIEVKIEELETNATINAAEKNAKINEYKSQLNSLTTKKTQIEEKYKTDKQRLKVLYKHK